MTVNAYTNPATLNADPVTHVGCWFVDIAGWLIWWCW